MFHHAGLFVRILSLLRVSDMREEMKDKYLADYINSNHFLVEEYHKSYCWRYEVKDDFKEQLRILFVNALNAGGQGKIEAKAHSINTFAGIIDGMKNPTYRELLRIFSAKSYLDLFESFSKRYGQMKNKKAALFLRDVLYFNNVITEVPAEEIKNLLVPVDRVITRTISSIFNEKYKTPTEAFNRINVIAKRIFHEKPILLEDLWFWGRFYRCKENEQDGDQTSIPYCEFNQALLDVDANVTRPYRDKLNQFVSQNKKCPFGEICEVQTAQ